MWANKSWVGSLFPPGAASRDFLSLYSRRFNTVEGNTTFYAIPSPETVERWRDDTPPGFEFCLKFPQAISHQRRLRGAQAETAEFLDRLARLSDRCGPSFLQLPPGFGPRQLATLTSYLDGLPADFRYAVEVRHPDFFTEPGESALDAALAERGVARVLFDARGLRSAQPGDEATTTAQARKPDVPVRFTRTAPFGFVRFIGHPVVEANLPLLAGWAEQVAGWLAAGDDVYFFLHSPDDAFAPFLAREMHALVVARYLLPPLPAWGEPPVKPEQLSLL